MIDKRLIEKKLRKIEDYLRELGSVNIADYDAFRTDIVLKRFIERNIELSIEQMVDVCKHFIAGLDLREPETYADCFEILREKEIVPQKMTETLKSMVRFRNILIHVYDGVDDAVTYGIYRERLEDFRQFAAAVREYLKKDIEEKM